MAAQHGQFFFDTIDPPNAAAGHEWGCPNSLLTGTSTAFALPSDPPQLDTGAAGLWNCTQPANAAVDPLVTIPGYGQGTAQLAAIEPTTEIPCDPTPRRLTVPCGQQKTHRVEGVVDENGAPIDTGDSTLEYVVEDGTGRDFGTGSATMAEPRYL